MKKLALVLVAVGLSFTTFAQKNFKIGHCDTQQILQDLAEKDSVAYKLQAYGQQLEAMYKQEEATLQSDIDQYMKTKATLSPEIARMKEDQLKRRSAALQQETLPRYQQEAAREEERLTSPVQEKVLAAIKKIAEENGFTYIIDESATLYAGGTDVTKLVRIALGLTPEHVESTTPPIQTGF